MPKPTFVICGAPKSGTSALFGYLREHPEVQAANVKEPSFFTRQRGQMYGDQGVVHLRGGTWNRGWEWYESLFEEDENAKAYGEASTIYLESEDTPELMHQYLPEARLIFLLREPVSRLYSHYWQELKTGIKLPDFAALVEQDDPRFQYYCKVSHYERNLKRYLQYFPGEQIKVLIHDVFRQDSLNVFQDVCQFIGVDPDFVPGTLGSEYNQQIKPRMAFIERWMNWWAHPAIREKMPHGLRVRLSKIKRSITRLNSTKQQYQELDPALWAALSPRFEDDIRYVEELTGMSLAAWRPDCLQR